MFCRDFDAFTGLLTAAPVTLSCANENGVKAAGWMLQERFDVLRPCFRPFQHPSAPSMGARPAGSSGPKKNLTFSLAPLLLLAGTSPDAPVVQHTLKVLQDSNIR